MTEDLLLEYAKEFSAAIERGTLRVCVAEGVLLRHALQIPASLNNQLAAYERAIGIFDDRGDK